MSSFVNPNMEADSASLSVVFIVSRLIPLGFFFCFALLTQENATVAGGLWNQTVTATVMNNEKHPLINTNLPFFALESWHREQLFQSFSPSLI